MSGPVDDGGGGARGEGDCMYLYPPSMQEEKLVADF